MFIPRGKEGSFERMRQFLQEYLKENEPFEVSTAYYLFQKRGFADDDLGKSISQKDFAMYLRTEVIRKDGLLKRAAHGVYEKRLDAEDRGVSFPRRSQDLGGAIEQAELYLDTPPATLTDVQIDAICEDATLLTARLRVMIRTLQQLCNVYPEHAKELASYSAGMLKDMDRVTTGISAVMAWCDDHTNEILVAAGVREFMESDDYSMEFATEKQYSKMSDKEIKEYLIKKHRDYLERTFQCEEQDHQWTEMCDGESGTSDYECQRCGHSFHAQW